MQGGGEDVTAIAGRVGPPDAAQVELTLAQMESLPTLPAVAVQLLRITTDAASHARDVARVIESDQSLASRLLSLTQRSHLGYTVDTVERAVVLLGFEAVRNLVLSIEIFETFSHRVESESERFDRVGFWKHSLAVGCAAKLLAQTAGLRKAGVEVCAPTYGRRLNSETSAESDGIPEEAFCCGLLHDLGKVALSACFPKTYDRVVRQAEGVLGNIADAEADLLGVDHTLAGRRLAIHWQLPEMIAQSIWLHHHAPDLTPTTIRYPHHVRLVQAADWLARQMRIGYSGNHAQDGPLTEAWLLRHLSRQELDRVRAELPELVESRAELIGLSTLTSKAVYQEALARANTELAQTNARLMAVNRELESHAGAYRVLRTFREQLAGRAFHEDICRAAVGAAETLAPPTPVVFLACSPHRKSVVLAAAGLTGGRAKLEMLPTAQAGGLQSLVAGAQAWRPMPDIGEAICERLTLLLGAAPTYVLPLAAEGRLVGAIFAAQPPPVEVQNALCVLGDWVLQWLRAADAWLAANQLNEELSNLNRRLAASQETLARIRSLTMIGEMAAGAAHELNNPLAVISGRAQMLRQDAADERVRRSADLITEHAQKASDIVRELMEFAKPTPPDPSAWDVRALLAEIRRACVERGSLSEGQFIVDVSDDVPAVYADAAQMRKLFDEVIRNAIEALSNTSAPRLVVNCQTDVADEEIVIRIEDNGTGMSPEVLEHVMDPFFSHRPAGRGRGLGLSRAVRYAEVNGGRIRLASRPGEGTTVLIWLPTARESR